jgi:hypothetical protein
MAMQTQDFLSEYIKIDELKALEATLNQQLNKVRKIISFLSEDEAVLVNHALPSERESNPVIPPKGNDAPSETTKGEQDAKTPSQLILSGLPQSTRTPKYSTLIPLYFKEHNYPIKSSDLVDFFHQHHNPSNFDRKKVAGMIFPSLTELYRKKVLRRDKDGFVHPI